MTAIRFGDGHYLQVYRKDLGFHIDVYEYPLSAKLQFSFNEIVELMEQLFIELMDFEKEQLKKYGTKWQRWRPEGTRGIFG